MGILLICPEYIYSPAQPASQLKMNCEKSVVKWHVKGTISIKKCKFSTQDLLLLQHFFSGGIFTEQEVMMWHGEEIPSHPNNIFHRKEQWICIKNVDSLANIEFSEFDVGKQ